MTTDTKTGFTFTELANFRAYEEVRSEGAWNMFMPQARQATGLTREEYSFVMKNYSELKAAAEADSDA
jgi:hypothetical protein